MANPNPSPATRFQPGVSGNPRGRPKGRSIAALLRDALDRDEIDGRPIGDGRPVVDQICELIVSKALRGDYRSIKFVLDRTEGRVRPIKYAEDVSARDALIAQAASRAEARRRDAATS